MSGTEEAAVAQPVAQQGEGPAPKATPTRPLLIIRQPSVVARMRAHEFRTHADSSIMPYYPGVGKLRGGAHASMRFTEQKKRIVVSKEVKWAAIP